MTALERRREIRLDCQRIHADHAREAAARGDTHMAEMLVGLAVRAGKDAAALEQQIADEQIAIEVVRAAQPVRRLGIRAFIQSVIAAIPVASLTGRW